MIMVIAEGIVDLSQGQMRVNLLLDLLRRVTVFGPAGDQPDGNSSPLENGLPPADPLYSHNIRVLRLHDCHSALARV
jgi:hypothetical protein